MIDQLWNWCRRSATIVWARMQIVLGLAGGLVLVLLEATETVDLKQFLPPQYAVYAPFIVAAIGFITQACRNRTLPKENA